MRSKFDEQLLELNKEMIEMGNKIIRSIKSAIEALVSKDVKMAESIMESDTEVDRLQKKIESICFNLLIQQQPVARDLRTVTAAMKMVTDMERIGDHAVDAVIVVLTLKLDVGVGLAGRVVMQIRALRYEAAAVGAAEHHVAILRECIEQFEKSGQSVGCERDDVSPARKKIECRDGKIADHGVGHALVPEFTIKGKGERVQETDVYAVLLCARQKFIQHLAHASLTTVQHVRADAAYGERRDIMTAEPGHDRIEAAVRHFRSVVCEASDRVDLQVFACVLKCVFDFHDRSFRPGPETARKFYKNQKNIHIHYVIISQSVVFVNLSGQIFYAARTQNVILNTFDSFHAERTWAYTDSRTVSEDGSCTQKRLYICCQTCVRESKRS